MIETTIVVVVIWAVTIVLTYDFGKHEGYIEGFEEADELWRKTTEHEITLYASESEDK